jgi:hypothetical protein
MPPVSSAGDIDLAPRAQIGELHAMHHEIPDRELALLSMRITPIEICCSRFAAD